MQCLCDPTYNGKRRKKPVFWARNQNEPYTPVFPVHTRADQIMEQIKRAKQMTKCIKKQDKQIKNSRVKIISH
jgi:hypothetical protein